MSNAATVYVIDDDPSLRKALERLCRVEGWKARTFASAAEFLNNSAPHSPACILLDLCMPGVSGLELQATLAKNKINTPVVFMTGHGDIPSSVRAMKGGAVDFLTKPFTQQELVSVIRAALEKDSRLQALEAERQIIQQRLDTLTPRENEVLRLVLQGFLNKQIAAELGASEQTIKVHRGRVMEKMQVESVADLMHAAMKVGLVTV